MNDETAPLPRPVSLAAVAAIFVLLSVFWALAVGVYVPNRPPAPQNEAPENLPKELAWRQVERHPGVRTHVADLGRAGLAEDQQVAPVEVEPDIRGLRLPVGSHCGRSEEHTS